MMRRVVVTGLGMVTPLACGVEPTWQRLLAGESGVRRIEKFEVSDLPCKIAGQIPRGDGSDGTFNPDQWMEPKEQRKVDDFILFAMARRNRRSTMPIGIRKTTKTRSRSGVLIGSGIGGIEGIAETALAVARPRPAPRVAVLHSRPDHQSCVRLRVDRAFAQGSQQRRGHRLLDRARTPSATPAGSIALGDADVMVAGGTESPVNRISLAGFAACRALSTGFNDAPERASRPYDRDRDGFVMGEGAGAVVLEEYEHAKAARRPHLRRAYRLRAVRRRLSHHRAGRRRRRRVALHEGGDPPRRNLARRDRLHQRPRHLDAARRRDRAQGRRAVGRQCGRQHQHVVDEILDRSSARRGRRGRGDLLPARHARPGRAADASISTTLRSPPRSISCRTSRASAPINVALSNSFGFGGTNASLVFRRLQD